MVEGTITQSWSDLRHQKESGTSCLVTIYPADMLGGTLELGNEPVTIGRASTCQVHLANDSISRTHARIERTEFGYTIHDLGSTNGTYVNDEKVASAPLAAGDRIHIGNHILKFLSSSDIEAQYHETVFKIVTSDGLTGAYNKRYLLDVLQREVGRAQRFSRSMAMLMMDLDHFKSVNDRYGHLAGDAVLQEFGRRVNQIVRSDDIFARYGGEEFALVVSETTPEEAFDVAERIRAAMAAEPVTTDTDLVEVTVSIGLTVYDGKQPCTPLQLIRRADMKLYEAKNAGRNRIVIA
jgi:diguanylate cyclase (GGDEF)-like protein